MLQTAVLLVATVLTAGWIFLGFRFRHTFDEIIATIDAELFQLPELFYIGWSVSG